MDRDCFDRLLLANLPSVQRFAIRLTGDPALAEDVAHDAIAKAVRGADQFRGQCGFTTWLYRIVVNCFRDRCRAKMVEEIDPNVPDARPSDPAAELDASELGRLIAERVSALPPRQREVLVLIAFERMSFAETAEVLDISPTSVRVNLSHARQRLRRELAGYLNDR